MNATNILIYFTLIFKKENENDQNNQETYESVVEAGLSNYVNSPAKNQVVLKELRTHSQNINGCLKPYYEDEQCNLSSAGITNIDLYDAKIPEEGKLLGYYVPLSKILYQKILHLDITSFSCFDIKEIYEIITSEIYIIMDNSMLLINCILHVLNTAKEKKELLYEHHWQSIRNQLVAINGFEKIEMQLTRSGKLEDREKVMADIVNDLLALNDDPMVCHSIQNIYDRFNLWNNKFLTFLKAVKKKFLSKSATRSTNMP
ncbi:putative LRR containing protein [Trachipleistophora hominis]|uniref:Putative LRR containing protein n=1 Tax=Trachipleistophora hominis TaxID=72359 RepID=L7JT27_TRAHO|nr:putative LRR containing protein [Trachipleistophora hominis]